MKNESVPIILLEKNQKNIPQTLDTMIKIKVYLSELT